MDDLAMRVQVTSLLAKVGRFFVGSSEPSCFAGQVTAGALEISMKKQPMAHDHLRWLRIPSPGHQIALDQPGEINATNRMGSKGQLAETFAELQKVR